MVRRGIRLLWSTVFAVTRRVAWQLEQIRDCRAECLQNFSQEHFGHTPFHFIASRCSKHWISVWNKSINSSIFFGDFIDP
jgi:hypothetical protein